MSKIRSLLRTRAGKYAALALCTWILLFWNLTLRMDGPFVLGALLSLLGAIVVVSTVDVVISGYAVFSGPRGSLDNDSDR